MKVKVLKKHFFYSEEKSNKKYIASVSWGKDSTAMLLKIIEKGFPLDEIVFFDTGMEFEEIYKTRDLFLEKYIKPLGIKYTELKSKESFLYLMLEKPTKSKNAINRGMKGWGWCGGICRWFTGEKLKSLNNYLKQYSDFDVMTYVGIAADEINRFLKLPDSKLAPLMQWNITEKEALEICYSHGFYFGGLYKILKRVSCWCCRNKNLQELANYKKYLPQYYKKLVELEKMIGEPMKKPLYLDERFKED